MGIRKSRDAIEQIELMRNLLAILLVGSFIAAAMLFTFVTIPVDNRDILTYMIGQISGMALTALGFYFVNKVGADALDAKRTENTGKAFDAVAAAAGTAAAGTAAPQAEAPKDAVEAADQMVEAAQVERDAIVEGKP